MPGFGASEYLVSSEDIAIFLNDILKQGDFGVLHSSIFEIARALGMTALKKTVGVDRKALYEALASTDPASPETVSQVCVSLGADLYAKLID